MQHRKDNFHRRSSGLFVDSHGNTTTVIHNRNGIIFIDGDINLRTKTGQCFIHGIVHYLIHQMMQSAGRNAADIHTRTLSYRFQTFQNLNLICSVFVCHGFLLYQYFLLRNILIFRNDSVIHPVDPIDFQAIFYKFIHSRTGDEGLDISDVIK